jgi:hypothetical protein
LRRKHNELKMNVDVDLNVYVNVNVNVSMMCSKRLESGEGVSAAVLASLMNENLNLRRRLYSDEGLCATTLDMVRTAHSVGAAAKFCGSGGAAVACCPDGEPQAHKLAGTFCRRSVACCMLPL